jgi:hypothetical protein
MALIMEAVCFGQHYTQTNLVSVLQNAPVTDSEFVNAWGYPAVLHHMVISENVTAWLRSQRRRRGAVFAVTILPADPTNKNTPKGSPTGTIFNGSQTDFLLAPGKPAVFLFSTIDGTIAGWNPNVAVAQGAAPPSRMP